LKKFLPVIFSFLLTFGLFYLGANYIYNQGAKNFVTETKNSPSWGYPGTNPHVNYHNIQGKRTQASMTKFITRVIPSKENKDYLKHLVFVGGSNTFGAGLNDGESFADSLIQLDLLTDYEPYIMAYQGWGPNNLLARMLDPNWHNFIKQKNGVMIYFFILNHIPRVCGEDSYFDWSSGVAPAFEIENEELISLGFHSDTSNFKQYVFKRGLQKIKKRFQKWMGEKEEFIDIIPPNDGELDRFNEHCLKVFAKIVAKMQEVYLALYPGSKFYVFTMPGYHMEKNQKDLKRIGDALQSEGVSFHHPVDEFIESFKAKKYEEMDIFLPDMHLNQKHHKLILPLVEKVILED
jgi:hypothetical protein